MAYFDWVEELAIDHGPIDNEHRKLVSLVNDMHAAAQHPNNHAIVGERMAELVFYTQDHLLNEEEVMATLGFPGLEEHKQSHIVFLARLHAMQTDFHQGDKTSASELLVLLKNWLSVHIRDADSELRDFLGDVEQIEISVPHGTDGPYGI